MLSASDVIKDSVGFTVIVMPISKIIWYSTVLHQVDTSNI